MKIDFEKTLRQAELDELDLDYIAENHNYAKVADRFGEGFQRWYSYISESMFLQAGGYPFSKDDLTECEWRSMGIISNYNKAKTNGN